MYDKTFQTRNPKAAKTKSRPESKIDTIRISFQPDSRDTYIYPECLFGLSGRIEGSDDWSIPILVGYIPYTVSTYWDQILNRGILYGKGPPHMFFFLQKVSEL